MVQRVGRRRTASAQTFRRGLLHSEGGSAQNADPQLLPKPVQCALYYYSSAACCPLPLLPTHPLPPSNCFCASPAMPLFQGDRRAADSAKGKARAFVATRVRALHLDFARARGRRTSCRSLSMSTAVPSSSSGYVSTRSRVQVLVGDLGDRCPFHALTFATRVPSCARRVHPLAGWRE